MKKIRIVWLLSVLLSVAFNFSLQAQTDVTNTGTLYIATGADTVFIGGSFTNTVAAALTNNRVLNIKQQLVNSQSGMTAGTGTLYLNGSTAQTVSGSQPFKTYHLVTDNSNGITLSNNLSVSGNHSFVNGIITTAATPNYLVYEAGASYSGDNDANHVNGWVKKLGNTSFSFPTGNGTYERPLALSSLAATSEFAVKYNLATTPNNTSLYGELVLVTTQEYWTLNRVSGGNAVVTLNWSNTKVPVPPVPVTDLRVSYYDGTFWKSIGGPGIGNILTTGTITSAATGIFNTNFTIGSTANLLPLQLVSFTASGNNGINTLRWHMTSEMGNEKYELQRSDNGNSFFAISTQSGTGAGAHLYQFTDPALTNNKIYYRLKYTGSTGLQQYSPIVTVLPATGNKDFYLLQNPVQEKIAFYASGQYQGTYNYLLAASNGQVVQSGSITIAAGGAYSIPLRTKLASGIYRLLLQNNTRSLQETIYKN